MIERGGRTTTSGGRAGMPMGNGARLPASSAPRRSPGPTKRRRPALIVTLVLMMIGFAIGGVVLVQRAGQTTDVLVAVHPVAVGQRIDGADLGTARVSASGVRAIAAENIDTVVGQTAAVSIVAGQLLNRDMLSAEPVPGVGHATVGLSLRPGQLPADGLEPGDHVQVVTVPGPDAQRVTVGAEVQVLTDEAQVYAVRADQATGGNTLVTLLVPEPRAAELAALGSAGRLGLVEVRR